MSQDPNKNYDFLSDLDFGEPDWLKDEPIFFKKETPEPSAPEPSPQTPPSEPSAAEAPHRSGSARPQSEPPARKPAEAPSWEQDRTDRRSRQSAPARRPSPAVSSRNQPNQQPRRRRKRGRRTVPILLLILLLIGGMIFAGWQLGSILLNYKRDRSAYEELAASALTSMAEPEDDRIVSHTPDPANRPQQETIVEEAVSEIPFTVDWEYLSSVNSDIVGWLYCPDTIINYPVVQNESHDYYLTHSFEGAYSSSGTLFADRSSVTGITQSHLIIYGHNMKDTSMFGTLKHYTDYSYFEDHPIFYYLTPDGSYRVELICTTVVESVLSNFPTYFEDTDVYQNYLDRITSGAYWVNSEAVSTDYQLMTFSTCTYGGGYNDPRLLVHGMMIPIE